MEDEGFAKIGSSSSSSSLWVSRLSPLAQPFTMAHQGSQSQSPNSLTSLNPAEPLAPSTISHLAPVGDSLSPTSFSNLIEDDQVLASSEFGPESFLQYPLRSFQGFGGPSPLIDELGIDKLSLTDNSSLSAHTQSSSSTSLGMTVHRANLASSSAAGTLGTENFLKQDTRITPFKVRTSQTVLPFSEYQTTGPNATFLPPSNTANQIGLSAKSSSKMLLQDEDDLDSPCWKGIQNSRKSYESVSEALFSNSVRNQLEAGPSLNPKAPQFIPFRAKGIMNNSQKTSVEDQLYVDAPEVGPIPGGFRQSNEIHRHENHSFVIKNSKASSALGFTPTTKPCRVDQNFSDINLEGFARGTMDSLHNGQANFSLVATEKISSCPSSGVGSLNDFSEILQCLSESLSNCANINVTMMVRAIHYLSKSLVQNYTNVLNDQDREMLHGIIHNLNALAYYRVGETQILGLPHSGNWDYCNKSTAINKPSNMDFEVTRSKDVVVSHELDSQSNHKWGNSYSHIPTKKMEDLASSSGDPWSKTGNGIIPVLRKADKNNHQIDEEVQPQALLSLWIEAQAALCSAKYENLVLRRKLKMTEQV